MRRSPASAQMVVQQGKFSITGSANANPCLETSVASASFPALASCALTGVNVAPCDNVASMMRAVQRGRQFVLSLANLPGSAANPMLGIFSPAVQHSQVTCAPLVPNDRFGFVVRGRKVVHPGIRCEG